MLDILYTYQYKIPGRIERGIFNNHLCTKEFDHLIFIEFILQSIDQFNYMSFNVNYNFY